MRFVVALLAALCVAVPAVAQQPAQDQPPPAGTEQSAPPSSDQPPTTDVYPSQPPQSRPPGPAAAPPPPVAPPMAQPGRPPGPSPQGKRMACRSQMRQKGLRGPPARDALQVCLLEAREACLKEAIAKNIIGSARRDFIKNCLN